ncbi:MAG: hypothetical protein K0Q59_5043 [Paenibacillus sp.]|jgi:predicted RNA-binding protein associated with RNAse of E/G family|nr:hypothetical protein [Paenibacillus sp.]
MKKKIADRPNWARVIEKRYVQQARRDEAFSGHVSLLMLDQVKAPLYVKYRNRKVCIVAQRFKWLMFFPDDKPYSLTVMIDGDNRITQWYFDIIKSVQLNEAGIPVIEDLYLDLVVLPGGEYIVLDEDELKHALKAGDINLRECQYAEEALEALRSSIVRGECALIEQTDSYLNMMLQMVNDVK